VEGGTRDIPVARRRTDARAIFDAAVSAVRPDAAVRRHLRLSGRTLVVVGAAGAAGPLRIDMAAVRRVLVVGAGKASALMAAEVEACFGDRVAGGVVTVKYDHGASLARTRVVEAGHPVPDDAGVVGAEAALDLLASARQDDLVVSVISGGGSALWPAPVAGVTLAEKQALTSLLLRSGATIHEINTVRKHLSRLKGGGLARAAGGARVLNLMLSDVLGDDLSVIASGPAVPDPTTYADAWRVVVRYGLESEVPPAVRARLEAGRRGEVPETPKPGDPVFDRVVNVVVASNRQAVDAAAEEASRRGYRPLVLSTFVDGETRDVARVHAAVAREVEVAGRPVPAPACLLSGGETTVTIRGDGRGGRNQEFTLAAGLALMGYPDGAPPLMRTTVLSAGTDGTDGPTDAAGALADAALMGEAAARGLDAAAALARHDSYRFFEPVGGLVVTGPTRTNVMDVRVVLVGAS
jgi:hydroxypyruvate reductase